jgi:clathrin heavy chain
MAANVLVEYIVSIDRTLDFSNKVNKRNVWRRLAKALLVPDIVYFYDFLLMYLLLDSYIKAADPSNFVEVIKISVMPASTMILFISFERPVNLFVSPKSIRSLHTCQDRSSTRHGGFLGMTNVTDIWSSERNASSMNLSSR